MENNQFSWNGTINKLNELSAEEKEKLGLRDRIESGDESLCFQYNELTIFAKESNGSYTLGEQREDDECVSMHYFNNFYAFKKIHNEN